MNTEIKKHIYSYILKHKKDSDKIYDPNFHKDWQSRVFFDDNDEILRWAILKIEFNNGRVVYNYTDEEGIICFPTTKNHTWKVVKKNVRISDKELSILKHINKIKEEEAEIYDPFVHKDWTYKEKNIDGKSYADCIFRYEFSDGKLVYAFSDAKSIVPSPNLKFSSLTSIRITEFYDEKKDDNTLNILAGVFIFPIILIGIFLVGRSNENSAESINRRAYNEYIKYNNLLEKKIDSVRKKNLFIYVYTNDFDSLSASISPNLSIYENSTPSNFMSYAKKQDIADKYKDFIENEETKGYDVWLKTKEENFNIINMVSAEDKYKVAQSYYYTTKEKEQVTKLRNKDKRLNSIIERRHIDSIQKASSVLSEKELLNSEFENPLKAILTPRINLKNKTHKFYFTVFSENATKKEVEYNVPFFEKMFLKSEKCSNCSIRKIRINTQN